MATRSGITEEQAFNRVCRLCEIDPPTGGLNGNSQEAEAFDDVYNNVRYSMLTMYPWSWNRNEKFLSERVVEPNDKTPWDHAYSYPEDYLTGTEFTLLDGPITSERGSGIILREVLDSNNHDTSYSYFVFMRRNDFIVSNNNSLFMRYRQDTPIESMGPQGAKMFVHMIAVEVAGFFSDLGSVVDRLTSNLERMKNSIELEREFFVGDSVNALGPGWINSYTSATLQELSAYGS